MAQAVVPREATRGFDPWNIVGWLTLFLIGLSLFGAFIYAPTDDFQGMTQRIFYVHLPSAWLAYLAFFVVFVASIMHLIRGSRFWDRIAVSSAELGVVFTTLALITGSLWGRQIWGAWWVWDARLTSTLVLWLIYVGYLMLRSMMGTDPRTSRYAAIIGIVGFIDVPIIHMSVTWWRTMHPTPIVANTAQGPQLPAEMLITMLVGLVAFTLLYAWLLRYRYVQERMQDEIAALRNQLAQGE